MVFWDVTPCGFVGRYEHFRVICYFHLHGTNVRNSDVTIKSVQYQRRFVCFYFLQLHMKSQPRNHKCWLIYFCDLLIPKDSAGVLLKKVGCDHCSQNRLLVRRKLQCSVEIFLYGSVAVIQQGMCTVESIVMFETFTLVLLKIQVFWDVMLCHWVSLHGHAVQEGLLGTP